MLKEVIQREVSQLLHEVKTISNSHEKVINATGERFNIFSILKVETKEYETHSRFLGELLNPLGSHNQGSIFLEKFISYFKIKDYKVDNSKVHLEFSLGRISEDYKSGGRADILIKNDQDEIILIENKIYAVEQINQLSRYDKSIVGNKRKNIFYLTLNGENSQYHELFGDYTPISYKTDIIKWLEECKKECVDIPIIRESITQYINLIKKITNQNLNNKMNEDITNRVLKDKDSFESFISLSSIEDSIYKKILEENVYPILEGISEKYQLTLKLDKKLISSKDGEYMTFSFHNEKMATLNIKIGFSFNVRRGAKEFIFGFIYILIKKRISNLKNMKKLE